VFQQYTVIVCVPLYAAAETCALGSRDWHKLKCKKFPHFLCRLSRPRFELYFLTQKTETYKLNVQRYKAELLCSGYRRVLIRNVIAAVDRLWTVLPSGELAELTFKNRSRVAVFANSLTIFRATIVHRFVKLSAELK